MSGVAHHVPDPEDDGSRADMATQTAAGGVPAVPGGEHRSVCLTTAPLAWRDTAPATKMNKSPDFTRPRPPSDGLSPLLLLESSTKCHTRCPTAVCSIKTKWAGGRLLVTSGFILIADNKTFSIFFRIKTN